MDYYLMNKEHKVVKMDAEIAYTKDSQFPHLEVRSAEILDKLRCPPSLLGECVNDISGELERWMEKRLISQRRKSIKSFPTIRWDRGNSNFFSMSDQYWLHAANAMGESWEKLNYFKAPYSNIVGQACASFNMKEMRSLMFPKNSPDLCTNGIQDKMWKRIEGKNYLLKWSNNADGQAILSEVLASDVLKEINIVPFVEYKLTIENYRLCSCCENFVNENEEFVPAWHLYRAFENLFPDKVNGEKEIYKVLMMAVKHFKIPNVEEFIDKMIIADRTIMNFDRHLGNFGFIRNVETGEYVGPAPLFDFGNAFFPDRAETKKERYIFSERMKYLLDDPRLEECLKKTKDISKNKLLAIPDFEVLQETIVRNVNLNRKELELDIAANKKRKKEREKRRSEMAISVTI